MQYYIILIVIRILVEFCISGIHSSNSFKYLPIAELNPTLAILPILCILMRLPNGDSPCCAREQNKRPAPEFPYWKFPRFSLNGISEDECLAEFRFEKQDNIPRLAPALRLPQKFFCSNETVANDIEALCLLLRRFAYPCRYSDLIPRFGRSVPEISRSWER